jgi:tetratricopeptide (TPR) repeat protein
VKLNQIRLHLSYLERNKYILNHRITILLLIVTATIFSAGCGNRTQKDLQKGMAKITKEDYKSAVNILEKAAKENPGNASIQCNLGLAYWKMEMPEKAIEAFESADLLSDNDSAPLEFIGQVYVEEGRFDEAQETFQLAAQRDPESARILTSLAVVEYYRGEFYNCEQFLKQAVKINADYAPALFNLAIMYRSRIGGKAKAEYYFSHYMKVAPNGPRKDIASGFVKLYNTAEKSSSKKKTIKKTAEAISAPITAQPIVPEKTESAQPEKTKPAPVAKVKPAPPQPETSLKIIQQKLHEDKIDEALILLERVITKYPESADALWMQATLYDMLGNKEKATDIYNVFRSKFSYDPRINKIPKVKPEPVALIKEEKPTEPVTPPNQSREALANYAFRKANALYDSGQYDEALLSYKKALKYDPNMINALYTLGHIYTRKKEYKQAVKYFERTVQQKHDLIEARYMLAVVNYELNNYNKAIEQLEIAIEMDPFYSKAFFMLGLINRKENNVAEAKRYLKRFLNIAPTSQQAAEARQWLQAYGE